MGYFGPTEIAQLWVHVAHLRKAKGDKKGAAQAYRNARAYRGRNNVASLIDDCPFFTEKRRQRGVRLWQAGSGRAKNRTLA